MSRTSLLSVVLILATASTASADVVHLTNGRQLEGKVVSQTEAGVRLEVSGGAITLASHMVAKVVRQETPHEALATRSERTDFDDPAAVESLANWASQRGLGQDARQLELLAQELRLQRRVDDARARRSPSAFIDSFYWGRVAGVADSVQDWLLDQAEALEPTHRALPAARELRRREVAERAAQEAAASEAEANRVARTQARRQAAVETRKRREVDALEEKLDHQRRQTALLQDRVNDLERRRRGVIVLQRSRFRRRAGVTIAGPRGKTQKREPLSAVMRRPLIAPRRAVAADPACNTPR